MRIGFIGAGVVGTALGVLFQNRGLSVAGYYSRSHQSAFAAAKRTGSASFLNPGKLLVEADIIFITTKDDAITEVAREIGHQGLFCPHHTVIHCSGSLTVAALDSAANCGAAVLSLHPLQSCATVSAAVDNLPNSVFSIEGDEAARQVGVKLVETLGGEYFFISAEKKGLYHAAAVTASNYLVTLMSMSEALMLAAGMPKEQFVTAIFPLIQGTLANIKQLGMPEALTGPIARGDADTISDHLRRIGSDVPELESFYKSLGLKTLELALAKKSLSGVDAAKIRELLGGGN